MAPVLEEQIEGNGILSLETAAKRLHELAHLSSRDFSAEHAQPTIVDCTVAVTEAIRQHREDLKRDDEKIRELTDELDGLKDCVEHRNTSMVELERSIKGRQAELEFYRSAAMGFLAAELAKWYGDLKSRTGEFTDSIRGTPENKTLTETLLTDAMSLMVKERIMKQELKK